MVKSGIRKRLAVAVLIALICIAPAAGFAQGSRVPVTSLKNFTNTPQYQLDITWSVTDSYEDKNYIAHVEMTATGRFLLKQTDKHDASARWYGGWQSGNVTYTGTLIEKSNPPHKSEWKVSSTAPMSGYPGADFIVGGNTPGYQLVAKTVFPVQVTTPYGNYPTILTLLTLDVDTQKYCTGPLPAAGSTIHGSMVIALPVEPFSGHPVKMSKVGVTYVLQPIEQLTPLVPPKHQ